MAVLHETAEQHGPMTLENTFLLAANERLRLYRLGQILQDSQTAEETTFAQALQYVGTLARKDIEVRPGPGTDSIEFKVSEDSWLRLRGFTDEAAGDNVRARQRDGIRPIHESTVTSVVELEMVDEQRSERRSNSAEAVRKGASIIATKDGLTMLPLIRRSVFPDHREYRLPAIPLPTTLPADFAALLPSVGRAIGSAAATIRRPVAA